MSEAIAISIVHGSGLVRQGVADLLKRESRVRVVGAFATAADALQQPDETTEVILYDLDTLQRDGIGVVDTLRETMPQVRVLLRNATISRCPPH